MHSKSTVLNCCLNTFKAMTQSSVRAGLLAHRSIDSVLLPFLRHGLSCFTASLMSRRMEKRFSKKVPAERRNSCTFRTIEQNRFFGRPKSLFRIDFPDSAKDSYYGFFGHQIQDQSPDLYGLQWVSMRSQPLFANSYPYPFRNRAWNFES